MDKTKTKTRTVKTKTVTQKMWGIVHVQTEKLVGAIRAEPTYELARDYYGDGFEAVILSVTYAVPVKAKKGECDVR